MFKARHLIPFAALVGTAVFGSACSADADSDESSESAATRASEDPVLFRDDFYAYMKEVRRRNGLTDEKALAEEVQKLVYLPTKAVMKPRIAGSPMTAEERLFAYDEAFKNIRPSQLFANGDPTKRPFRPKPVEELEETLRKHPVHIVLFPGIFSEAIPRTPFEELFRADTAARREFAVKGAAVKDERLVVGKVRWDEAAQRYVPTRALVPLTGTRPNGEDALVRVASFDDAEGKPLVTVGYLQANIGSLEDFGTLEQDSETYLHRLDKYFEAVGIPENIYLMGYSRGAVTGLDLLVRAREAGKPWASKIKGFISHAGVIYGSQLADASFTSGPSTELVNVLEAFVGDEPKTVSVGGKQVEVRNLASCEDLAPLTATYNKLIAWPRFLWLAKDLAPSADHPELAFEGIDAELPDLGRLSSFIAMTLGIPLPGVPVDPTRSIVQLKFFDQNHCQNVESFKITARAILAGAKSLTTKERLDWWRNNVVPSDVKYFALTGTMGDATSEEGNAWKQATNSAAYDLGSIDFRSLRGNFYDFLKASGGIQLQDSQVSVERGRFWSELEFNPNQHPIEAHFMGTMGTHHWGLAFPRAFSTSDGRDCPEAGVSMKLFAGCGNPFPRTVLLKTIATFVAQTALSGH